MTPRVPAEREGEGPGRGDSAPPRREWAAMAPDAPGPAGPEGIRSSVRGKYRAVARDPAGQFPYPVGVEGLARLGYDPAAVAALPPEVAGRFVGIGNPLSLRPAAPGERVLDAGCGCGADAFLSARAVGPSGRVVGVDLVPEMLEAPRAAAAAAGLRHLEFLEGDLERLPLPDGSFDLAISNGALNLVPDKDAAYRELARVLRPGGVLAAADLAVVASIPAETLRDMDAWSS